MLCTQSIFVRIICPASGLIRLSYTDHVYVHVTGALSLPAHDNPRLSSLQLRRNRHKPLHCEVCLLTADLNAGVSGYEAVRLDMDGKCSNLTAVELRNSIRVDLDIVTNTGAIGGGDRDPGTGHRQIVFTVQNLDQQSHTPAGCCGRYSSGGC